MYMYFADTILGILQDVIQRKLVYEDTILSIFLNMTQDNQLQRDVTGKRGNVEINNSPQAGIEPGAS